jgi:nicotinamide mononucleotide transporter
MNHLDAVDAVGAILTALQRPALGPVSWAELFGDATGIACVWLTARKRISNWPVGLLNNAFFFLLFWWAKLYGDATLQAIFAALGIYGWWAWARGSGRSAPVRHGRAREWAVLVPVTAVATVFAAGWLARHTDSPVPRWDATVLCLSLAATYAQARKVLESWWLWIAVDLLSVPLYAVRGLYPTAALYAVFLGLCVVGLRAWARELRAEEPSPAARREAA